MIKGVKLTTPNNNDMFSLRNVKHTDTGSFGLLFDVVRHEAAEVRPGGFRDFQDRSRDRLSAYDADRGSFVAERQRKDRYLPVDKPVSPEDRRLPVESVPREDVSAHEPMQNQPAEDETPPSETKVSDQPDGYDVQDGLAGENDNQQVATDEDTSVPSGDDSSETGSDGDNEDESVFQGLPEQMMLNALADQLGSALVREQVSGAGGTNHEAGDQTVDPQKQGQDTQVIKAAVRQISPADESSRNVQKGETVSIAPKNEASQDEVKLSLAGEGQTDDDGPVFTEGKEKSGDTALPKKVVVLPVPEPSQGTVQKTNIDDSGRIVLPDDFNESSRMDKDNLKRTAQAAKQSSPLPAEPVTVAPQFDTSRFGQSNANSEHKSNNGRFDISGQGNVKISAEKPANIQDVLGVEKAADSIDMQQNVDRVVKAARAIVNRGASTIQLRLEPPDLGNLRIEIKHGANGLSLQLQATNHRAHQLLQQSSGELRAALEAQGFQTNRIDVQLRLDLRNDQASQQDQGRFDHQNDQGFHEQFQQSHDQQSHRDDDGVDYNKFSVATDSMTEATESFSEPAEPVGSAQGKWQEMKFGKLDLKV